MRKLIAIVFVLVSSLAVAQEIEWQKTIGGSGPDVLNSVIQTVDGGYLLGGWSDSNISGDKTENGIGYYDYWILKVDFAGNIEWQNTIGGADVDYLYSIIQTADGGYLLGGSSDSDWGGDKLEYSNGEEDFWIVKTDSVGNIQWQNTIGGLSYDILRSLIQTPDGGYLLGGSSYSDISGDKSENSKGADDFWIIKTNSLGNILWQKTIGGSGSDNLISIIQTPVGGYLLGGYSSSNASGNKNENSRGGYDYWIININANGNINWQRTIGGNNDDMLTSVILTSDNGFLLGGYSSSIISGDKTENSIGSVDYWIVKVDQSGNIQWQNTIGGTNGDALYSLEQTADYGYILGGLSASSISRDKTENSLGGYDYWIVKTDSLGTINWQNTIGGSVNDGLISIQQTTDGGCILGGHSGSNISGDKTENTNGGEDFWIVKITSNYNLIQGKTYADLNSNQVQELSDPSIPYLKVTESNNNRVAFSQPNGFYNVAVLDIGNFEVAPDYVNLYNPTPLVHTGNFNAIQQIDSLNDFAFQPSGTFNDLCISISPTSPFRSGFYATYSINYSNYGTTTLTPTIVFYPDTNVTFVSASVVPSIITTDSVVFSVNSLTPFQTGQIAITVSVNAGLPIGTLINSGAMILPIANDANPGCNSSYWEVYTTGSIDPNDIIVNRNFLYDYEMPSPPDLEYIINFQNTGNDTAFTVKLLNPIDTNKLDLSTLEIVATSHLADIQFVYHERNLEFLMNNILLPDSNVNEMMSHGFVRYRIKPKSNVAVGDSIQNFAAIYFDFNNLVITNTALTNIIMPTGLPQTSYNTPPTISPNPANEKITIRLTGTAKKIETITIYNLYGQQVKNIAVAPSYSTEINIADLASGIYLLKINNENGFVSKIVKY